MKIPQWLSEAVYPKRQYSGQINKDNSLHITTQKPNK